MRSTAIIGAMAALAVWPSTPAHADGAAQPGTRALGTGGAMRAAATGDAGPMLNPSGIMLIRSYTMEGAYQYGSRDSTHDAHVSLVDSTSAFNLGGGLFYTFHSGSPTSASQTAHLGGVSLSFPLGDLVFLGGTAKYMHLSTDMDSCTVVKKGFTFDAGLTVRLAQFLSLAAVGYNLTNPKTSFAPRGVGGGVSLSLVPGLLLLADSLLERVYNDPTRSSAYYMMGGAEYLAKTMAIRLGGGWAGPSRNGYLSGGLSTISPTGALDISMRQDISGDRKGTFVGVSGRLFVPTY